MSFIYLLAQIPGLPTADDKTAIQTALNFAFGILGALALVYMTMAGLQLITSKGNPEKVAKARNSILYGVIGITVAVTAVAIVNLVISKMK